MWLPWAEIPKAAWAIGCGNDVGVKARHRHQLCSSGGGSRRRNRTAQAKEERRSLGGKRIRTRNTAEQHSEKGWDKAEEATAEEKRKKRNAAAAIWAWEYALALNDRDQRPRVLSCYYALQPRHIAQMEYVLTHPSKVKIFDIKTRTFPPFILLNTLCTLSSTVVD